MVKKQWSEAELDNLAQTDISGAFNYLRDMEAELADFRQTIEQLKENIN
jgi:hypothetical protein